MSELLAQIVRGEYPPGERIPKETDLAREHDVSRYVARECILALRNRGVLQVRHGVGATVLPPEEWQFYDPVLIEALLAGPVGREVLGELQDVRLLLWPEAAALAAQRRTDEDLERLEAAVGSREAFEAALLASARNRFLLTALTAFERGLHAAGRRDRRRLEPVLDAVRAGDADAARAAMASQPRGRAAKRAG